MFGIKRLCYNKNMKKTRGGFTLIEMALSLVFIGILSVMIVVLIQNTTASYRRGLILNQLNTVGMDLIDDIRSSVQMASTDSLYKLCQRLYGGDGGECAEDKGNSFSTVTKYGKVVADGVTIDKVPVYGAFCTGYYTYIWNSGYFEAGQFGQNRKVYKYNTNQEISPIYLVKAGDSNNIIAKDFRMLKIYDKERTICRNVNNRFGSGYRKVNTPDFNTYNGTIPDNYFEIDGAMLPGGSDLLEDKNKEGGVELLKNSVNDLVIYDFYMTRPAMSETRQNLFFAGSFILGTRRGGINIMVSGNSCKPPSDNTGYSDLEYCAINKFNFAVQAGGE